MFLEPAALPFYDFLEGCLRHNYNEMVIFESVSDNIADFGASKGLGADKPVGAPASPDGESIQRVD